MKNNTLRPLYLFLILVGIAVAMGCCGRRGAAWRGMDRAERLMAVSPDSAPAALAALDSITPGMLGGGEEKARYALLKSMALDKNYIDTTDFKVLQPAIDYYLTKDKGTPDDKLRTYYYQGRIYQNQGDDDAAMQSFMRGRDLSSQVKDTLTLANLMVAQGTIFITTYKYDEFIKVNLDGAKLYNALGRYDYEIMNLTNALDGCFYTDNKMLADSIFTKAESLVTGHRELEPELMTYYLSYAVSFGNRDDVQRILCRFDSIQNPDDSMKIDLASAYRMLGDSDTAMDILNSIPSTSEYVKSLNYMAVKSRVFELKGNYPEALVSYRQFYTTLDSIHNEIFTHDLLFAQQRHEMEKANLLTVQKKNTLIWISLSVILFLTIITVVFYHLHKIGKTKIKQKEGENKRLKLEHEILKSNQEKAVLEEENMRLRINALEQESASLRELLEEHKDLEKSMRDFILERIEMLNGLVSTYISDRRVNSRSIDLIEDRDKFLESTRRLLIVTHPKFIEYIDGFDLTDIEKNCLYLYAIGLQGKEIGTYLNMRRHYHIGVEIRRKLGLSDKDSNLSKYIRNLIKEL